MDFDPSVQALQAFGTGMQMTAHNVANINTPDFTPQSYSFASGPQDRGVRIVQSKNTDISSLPDWKAETIGDNASQKFGLAPRANLTEPSGLELGLERAASAANGVDMSREITNMMRLERGVDANAAMIRSMELMTGTVVDVKS